MLHNRTRQYTIVSLSFLYIHTYIIAILLNVNATHCPLPLGVDPAHFQREWMRLCVDFCASVATFWHRDSKSLPFKSWQVENQRGKYSRRWNLLSESNDVTVHSNMLLDGRMERHLLRNWRERGSINIFFKFRLIVLYPSFNLGVFFFLNLYSYHSFCKYFILSCTNSTNLFYSVQILLCFNIRIVMIIKFE